MLCMAFNLYQHDQILFLARTHSFCVRPSFAFRLLTFHKHPVALHWHPDAFPFASGCDRLRPLTFTVPRCAFCVHRSSLRVNRSPFRVHRSSFRVHRSPFRVHRSAIPFLRSSFCVPRSSFCVPRSSFPVPRSSFFVPRSSFCDPFSAFNVLRPAFIVLHTALNPKNTNLNNGQDAIYKDGYLEESLKNLFTEHSNQNQHYYLTKWSSPNFQIRTVKRSNGRY